MGVRQLWKILDEQNAGSPCGVEDLLGQTVAIDFSCWLVASDRLSCREELGKRPQLRSLFYRLLLLFRHGVKPVLVLEGEAPTLKHQEIKRRHQEYIKHKSKRSGDETQMASCSSATGSPRKSWSDTVTVNECCELCSYLGVPVVYSEGEAEATCAALNQTGKVDACISNDGDAFLFGAQQVYRDFQCKTGEETMTRYKMADIEQKLGLDREKLVTLALLVSCDFTSGASGVGMVKALKFLADKSCDRPIQKLLSWRNDKTLDTLTAFPSKTKPTHCSCCGHPGSVKQHRKSGCSTCGIAEGCCSEDQTECACNWHKGHREYLERKKEIQVREQALKDPSFPDQKIIDLFMGEVGLETAKKIEIEFGDIQFEKLKTFIAEKLGSRVSEDKLTSMLIAHHLLFASDVEKRLQPDRIKKSKREGGEDAWVISWKSIDGLTLSETGLSTTEVKKTFSWRFPDLVQQFEREQEILSALKKKRKQKREETPAGQRKIIDFMKVRKKLFDDKPSDIHDKGPSTSDPVKLPEPEEDSISGRAESAGGSKNICVKTSLDVSQPGEGHSQQRGALKKKKVPTATLR